MRRKLVAITALLCLVAAGAAYGAAATPVPDNGNINTYTGAYDVSHGAGTANKPVAVSMVEHLGMASVTAGNVGAPLTDIKSTIYGLKSNGQYFPKCTVKMIDNAGTSGKWNGVCPKGSLVASGTVNSVLVNSTLAQSAATPCNLKLWVYNAGPGQLAYFFTVPGPSSCAGLPTGAAAAYSGTVQQAGKNLINDVKEPADISTSAGNISGTFGSLVSETLNWKKLTVKVKGKVYPYLGSTGCKSGKRPYAIKYTATTSSSLQPQYSATVTGTPGC
jgi:hypothetical protein